MASCFAFADSPFRKRVFAADNDENGTWAVQLLADMLQDEAYADVELATREGTIVKAHRVVLARASPVLRLALERNRLRLFQTERWSEASIRQVRCFLYQKQAELSLETAVDVAQMAKELGLERLQIEALTFIKDCMKEIASHHFISAQNQANLIAGLDELNRQSDFIEANMMHFQQRSRVRTPTNSLDRMVVRRTSWIESYSAVNWPIYTFNGQSSELIISHFTEVLLRLSPCWVSSCISKNKIFLLATKPNDKTLLYHVDTTEQPQAKWQKHPKTSSEPLYHPVVLEDLFYAYGGRNRLDYCSRWALNSATSKSEEFHIKNIKCCLAPLQIMRLDGQDQVVVPCYTRDDDSLQIQIYAWEKTRPQPELVKEAFFRINGLLDVLTVFVLNNSLHLVFKRTANDISQVFTFHAHSGEITHSEPSAGLVPAGSPFDATLISCTADGALFLWHNDEDIKDPGQAWKFSLRTREWQQLSDSQIKRQELALADWQAYLTGRHV